MASWAVIIANGKILMIRRSTSTSRPHQWCFVGGRIHAHETPESACIREAQEEIGVNISIIKLIQQIKDDYYFLCCLCAENTPIQLKIKECDAFSWITPSELLSLGRIMDFKNCIHIFSLLGFQTDFLEHATIPSVT